jgi:lipopolysaccharide exporter
VTPPAEPPSEARGTVPPRLPKAFDGAAVNQSAMTDERDLNGLRAASVRGLRWVMIARPLVECVLLGSMVALARLISPAEFGHFAIASLIAGFGGASVSALTTALVQRAQLDRDHLQAANALALGSGVVLLGLTLVAANLIVVPIFGTRTAELVRLSAPGTLVAAASVVPLAVLQRQLAFRRLSIIDVTGTSTRALGSVILAVAGLNGSALVLGVLAGTVVQTAVACAWAPPPAPRVRRDAVREVLHFGLPNWVAALSWIGFQNCDYAIVGARLGALQAGFYFRAYTLGVEYQKKVSQVMDTVGFPVLARTRSSEDMGTLRAQMVRLLTVLLFPLLALLAVVAPVAVPWLFGPVWRPAVAPTQVLAIGGGATLVIDAVGSTLMAAGRPRAVLGFGWAHFAAYASAVFVTAPLGLTAVASSAAVVHTAFVFVAYWLMLPDDRRHVPARIWSDVGPAVASCLALVAVSVPASVAMSAVHAAPIVDLTVVSLGGACAYLGILRRCFPETWRMLVSFIGHLLPGWLRRRPAAAVEMAPAAPLISGGR